MATQLIKHLEECAKNDAVYKPLEAQWSFDEPLIAKALQNVSVWFPHYSRHDESHSRQILVHIERLLGQDNISKLTATDTWLLLEAAYLHDIGMIVPHDHLNKDFEEIKKYLEKIRHAASGDTLIIIDALLASKAKTASSVFATVDFSPLYTVKLLREVLADFYRSKHPERANTIVSAPWEIGLNSPRTELIPARLFGLLGKICAYHGADFKKVMELPKQQVGIGTDDCHPRFVACLLRLGDLLDLDDNRFCPVMMKMAGDLPDMSKAHHDKHLAIRHFRADPDRIEIEADCPSYESYIETTKWFGWLREEVKNQMSCWFDIVPKRNFGLLPSVGDLKAHLKDWQVFNENERPQFTLDRDRIFELLQGAGLYENKEQAMRELLQNAVDATLIRIWREYGEDCNPQPKPYLTRNSAPRSEDTLKILNNYTIDVSIEKIKEEGQYNYWRVTITDQGTGISRDDLKFMLQMGGSKKNLKKREIIKQMPVWMKPSGIFGIGLHSVFMLTDEVCIESRSIYTGETLLIRLTSPTSDKEHGNAYFRVITESTETDFYPSYGGETKRTAKPWDFSRYGCQLSFVYKTQTTLEYINEADHPWGSFAEARSDKDIKELQDAIATFFPSAFICGKLKIDNQNESLPIVQSEYHYIMDEKLEFRLKNTAVTPRSNKSDYLYRGQMLDEHLDYFYFMKIAVNLLDDEADQILTINRNRLKIDKRFNVSNRVKNAVVQFFQNEGGNFYKKLSKEEQIEIVAEFKLMEKTPPFYFCNWDEVKIHCHPHVFIKIKELSNYTTIFYAKPELNGRGGYNDTVKNLCDEKSIYLVNDDKLKNFLVISFLKNEGFNPVYCLENNTVFLKISKQKEEPISVEQIKEQSQKILAENYTSQASTMPCLLAYQDLAIANPDFLPLMENENFGHKPFHNFDLDVISPRMLFPLARIGDKITMGNLEILVKRVYLNRKNREATETQIKEKYQEFIAFLDKLMQDEPGWKEKRGDEFKPAE